MRAASTDATRAPRLGRQLDQIGNGDGLAAPEGLDRVGHDVAPDRPRAGGTASCPRSARVRSSRSSTSAESRRTWARANARSAGATGLPASSCRSASWSVIASGPSAFLISCAAAASERRRSAIVGVVRRRSAALRSCALEDGGDPLPDADAHRRQAVAARRGGRARAPASSTSRAPEQPSGWPIAIAPPFTLTRRRIEPELAHAGDRLRGERLVQLDEIEIARRRCRRAPAPSAWPGSARGPSASARRRRRAEATKRASGRPPEPLAAPASRRQQQRRRAVVDPRRVAGRHRPALLAKHRRAARPARRRSSRGAGARRPRTAPRRPLSCLRPSSTAHELVGEPPGRLRGAPSAAGSPARTRPAPRATRRTARRPARPSRPARACRSSASMRGLTNRQPSVLS